MATRPGESSGRPPGSPVLENLQQHLGIVLPVIGSLVAVVGCLAVDARALSVSTRAGSEWALAAAAIVAGVMASARLYTDHKTKAIERRVTGSSAWAERASAALLIFIAVLMPKRFVLGVAVAPFAVAFWFLAEARIAVRLRRARRRGAPVHRLYYRFLFRTPVGRWIRDCLRVSKRAGKTPEPWLRKGLNTISGITLVVMILGFGSSGLGALSEIANSVASTPSAHSLAPTSHATPHPPTTPDNGSNPNDSSNPGTVSNRGSITQEALFSQVCGSGPEVIQPGQGAPSWAAVDLFNLYFAKGTGLGANILGCPTKSSIVNDSWDSAAYQEGYDAAGNLIGLTIRTERHGSVAFIGDVAAYAASLIKSGLAVSGDPRVDVGQGDLQLLDDAQGTTAFVRITKSTSEGPTPYVILDPAETTAWISEMSSQHEWLWPTSISPGVVSLTPSNAGPAIATISEAAGQSAILNVGGIRTNYSSSYFTNNNLTGFGVSLTPG